jgi:LmbE family N-acetylglucosaminyl deacetylase
MFERVLVIGAHTDDIEMMCGGTIAKLIGKGCDVHYATFSFADKSLPEGYPEGTTRQEVGGATKVLGISLLNLYLHDYEVRVFPQYRQEILEDLVSLRKEIAPNLVLTHNSRDTHQDHKTISDETYRAFKQSASIWGYESFKNNRSFDNDIYVKITIDQINKKIQAVSRYHSQLAKVDNRQALIGLARFRGAQINHDYAECFQALRIIQ